MTDKHAAERERLIRAGWAVMRRNGYANANITDILAEAELGTRAFYRHFSSKDDLIVEIFRQNAEVTGRHLAERTTAATTAVGRVGAWIDAVLDLGYDARHREAASMFTSPTISATIAPAGVQVIAAISTPLADALAEGAASGELPECDPVADARTIHAIVWQLFEDALYERATLDRAGARRQADRFVFRALGISVPSRPV